MKDCQLCRILQHCCARMSAQHVLRGLLTPCALADGGAGAGGGVECPEAHLPPDWAGKVALPDKAVTERRDCQDATVPGKS